MPRIVFGVVATILAVFTSEAKQSEVSVTIEQGTVVGVQNETVAMFKGIRYVEPVTNDNRWQPPEPLSDSSQTFQSRDFGKRCPQSQAQDTSEDCLFINVFTAQNPFSESGRPVLVWIHGGGFVGGAGNLSDETIEHWVNQGVVLVSFNYRLGALGIFAHPQLANSRGANFSLMDMVAALEWVGNNIAAFGGNPGNITIAGGSAGGMAVQLLMVSQQSEGLFHHAISQSGYGTWPLPRTSEVAPLGGSPSAEMLAEGIASRASGKREALNKDALYALSPGALVSAIQGFHLPVVDGQSLPEEPGILFSRGEQHAVPYLSGGNSFDGSVYPYSGVQPDTLLAMTNKYTETVQRHYGLSEPSFQARPFQHLFGDMRYVLAAAVTAAGMQNTLAPGYRYFFDMHENGPGRASHGSEVNVLFTAPASDAQRHMQAYWRNFIVSGNPNSEALPDWKAVDAKGENWMVLGKEIRSVKTVREKKLSTLMKVYRERVKPVVKK